jgi:tRNA A-37 threonylcarbamoyl transferase component Bud32
MTDPIPVPATDKMPVPPPVDLGATIRDEEGSSTDSDSDAVQAPPPRIDKPRPGAVGQQRYAIEALVGRGATSQVFAANDLVFDRRIAIKFLAGTKVDEPRRIGRFMREAKLTAALEHPNVAPIYDLDFTHEGAAYFSMRMITGTSLGEALREAGEGRRPATIATPFDLVNIMLRVCDAVGCAHGKGILHRDIKPENIMLGSFGEVVLVDWGSALVLGEEDGRPGRIIGTPHYMSPEQARGEVADRRSDIHCLGASLFHGLTGRQPTGAASVSEFWEKKRRGEVDPPTAAERANCPLALLDVALKALRADPAQRYQDVAALADDLRRWQAGLAVSAHRESAATRLRRWHRRHWRGLWGSTAILATLLASAAVLYGERLKEIARWGAPIDTQTFGDGNPPVGWLVTTGGFAVRDGEWVSTGSSDSVAYFLRRLGGGVAMEYDARMLPGNAPCDLSVTWSEREPRIGQGKARYTLQLGAYDNSFAQIEEEGRSRLAFSPMRLETGRRYHVRMEIEPERLAIIVDGKVVCACDLDVPIGMGYVGLYAYYPGKAFTNIRVYSKGVPERISSLALGDRDLREGLFKRAAGQYSEIATAHPGKPIADEARFRQGYALQRLGDEAAAEAAWAGILDGRMGRRAEVQQLYAHLETKAFTPILAGIRRLAALDPSLRDRLVMLWSATAVAALAEPPAQRQAVLACYDETFPPGSGGADSAARLLASLDRNQELLDRYPGLPAECSQALRALGRSEEIPQRYPGVRYWCTLSLLDRGLYDQVLALDPPILWARDNALYMRGTELARPSEEFLPNLDSDMLFQSGRAQWVLDHPAADSTARTRALIFLDRCDEALLAIPSDLRQSQLRWVAAALAGREDIIRGEFGQVRTLGSIRPVLGYWLAFRAYARGDAAAARRELAAFQVGQGWYTTQELAITHGLLADFLAFAVAGDRKPFAACLAAISATRKGVFEQRLWYAAEYISGHLDDTAFLAQPVVLRRTGFLAICRALRAEWEGRAADAGAAYRAYLALPPYQRLVIWNERDPAIEAFAAWRGAALSGDPAALGDPAPGRLPR